MIFGCFSSFLNFESVNLLTMKLCNLKEEAIFPSFNLIRKEFVTVLMVHIHFFNLFHFAIDKFTPEDNYVVKLISVF